MIEAVELFAGVGGFKLGLEQDNPADGDEGTIRVIMANQWEPATKIQHAFDCYRQHFEDGIHVNEDIAKLTASMERIPAHDLLVGGFPCQDYSVARSLSGEKGIEGHKGVLFWEIMKVVETHQPQYILLENVDRLLKSPSKQRGRDFSIMLASLANQGYLVEWRVINAAEYGFQQRRRRTFIFATLANSNYGRQLLAENPLNIILKKGFFAPAFPVERNDKLKIEEAELSEDVLSVSDSFSFAYKNAGILLNRRIHTAEIRPVLEDAIPLSKILLSNVDDEKYYLTAETIEKMRYLKGSKRIERTSKSGHTYIFSEGSMNFPEDIKLPGRTMLTSEGTVNRSSHVVCDPGNGRLRFLTPVECERLNGFPDNWTNMMPDRKRYFCMGNALVVGLIARMAQRIREIEVNIN